MRKYCSNYIRWTGSRWWSNYTPWGRKQHKNALLHTTYEFNSILFVLSRSARFGLIFILAHNKTHSLKWCISFGFLCYLLGIFFFAQRLSNCKISLSLNFSGSIRENMVILPWPIRMPMKCKRVTLLEQWTEDKVKTKEVKWNTNDEKKRKRKKN